MTDEKGRQTKNIKWTITIPMDFPDDWDENQILFNLNESSWCCSELVEALYVIDRYRGCLCDYCEAEIVD